MKIVSSFLFSEPYERDVLLAKFHSECEVVDEFVGIESAYSTRNTYKGLHLWEVLSHEDFKPFLDKITILSNESSFYPTGDQHEQNNLVAEFNSRAYCWDYIRNKYEDNDWLVMADADEMLNFSRPASRDILLDIFKRSHGGVQIWNQRMWWDWINLAPSYEKYIPCHKIGALKERERPFDHRNRHCTIIKPHIVCAYEYCYCFTKEGNWRKVTSAAHDKYQIETMENAYRYNTFHKESQRGEQLQYPYDFFETVELTEENSPAFVLENIDKLKVNTIDSNYAENRFRDFNIYPHPCEQAGLMQKNKIDRKSHYYRRSR